MADENHETKDSRKADDATKEDKHNSSLGDTESDDEGKLTNAFSW